MAILGVSILALFLGPLIQKITEKHYRWVGGLDGFVFVAIGGMVLLEIIPHGFDKASYWALLAAFVGFLGPGLIEAKMHRAAHQAHSFALGLALFGLGFHAFLDGAALIETPASSPWLPLAVILHRLPVGMTIWWLLRPTYGLGIALAALSYVALATYLGFGADSTWLTALSSRALACFQALVAGSLLHVVVHAMHIRNLNSKEKKGFTRAQGIGALIAVLTLSELFELSHMREMGGGTHSHIENFARTFWSLARESAPALLLGYIFAGLMTGFLPQGTIRWMNRGSSLVQSLRGVVFGLPLPICSCGVVPIYRGLIQRRAAMPAAMSFLIATPELGIGAVILSFSLLGTEMTLLRVIAGFVVAFLVGWWVPRFARSQDQVASTKGGEVFETSSRDFISRMKSATQFGLGEVVDHTGPWILLGLVIAAAIEPVLMGQEIAFIGGYWEVLIFALIGMPTYVCASGATPIVAVFLLGGVSPGAALAFLLTGPATNVTTFGLVRQLHGQRVAVAFSVTVALLAIGGGYLVNFLWQGERVFGGLSGGHHHDEASFLEMASLWGLGLIFAGSLIRQGPRAFLEQVFFLDLDQSKDEGHCHHC